MAKEQKYLSELEITIKLSNTTGKEDINQLVQHCFGLVSNKVQVDSFKQINSKNNSEAAAKLIVKASFIYPIEGYEDHDMIMAIKKAINSHWQCELKSCVIDGEERYANRAVNAGVKGLGLFADTLYSSTAKNIYDYKVSKESEEDVQLEISCIRNSY